jgi:hypothetical protein
VDIISAASMSTYDDGYRDGIEAAFDATCQTFGLRNAHSAFQKADLLGSLDRRRDANLSSLLPAEPVVAPTQQEEGTTERPVCNWCDDGHSENDAARAYSTPWCVCCMAGHALRASRTGETACHCGRLLVVHSDSTGDYTRGMCEECDAVRCDVDPTACPFRGETACGHTEHGIRNEHGHVTHQYARRSGAVWELEQQNYGDAQVVGRSCFGTCSAPTSACPHWNPCPAGLSDKGRETP